MGLMGLIRPMGLMGQIGLPDNALTTLLLGSKKTIAIDADELTGLKALIADKEK